MLKQKILFFFLKKNECKTLRHQWIYCSYYFKHDNCFFKSWYLLNFRNPMNVLLKVEQFSLKKWMIFLWNAIHNSIQDSIQWHKVFLLTKEHKFIMIISKLVHSNLCIYNILFQKMIFSTIYFKLQDLKHFQVG